MAILLTKQLQSDYRHVLFYYIILLFNAFGPMASNFPDQSHHLYWHQTPDSNNFNDNSVWQTWLQHMKLQENAM